MNSVFSGALFMAATAVLVQAPSQGPTLGLSPAQKLAELRHLADQAKKSGDLPSEVLYLCQAAALDVKKFGKKCDRAKGDATKALAQFHADLEMGRGEMQRKDYAGALRDLGKIIFGPEKAEAQQWMEQARIGLSGGVPVDPASLEALNAARAAYSRGDFDEVEPLARRIQAPPIQAAASQLLANITTYREAMKEGDELFRKGDLKGADEKYRVAATIQRDGPGHPEDRLREVQAAEAKASANSMTQPAASPPIPVNAKTSQPLAKSKYPARNQGGGAAPHHEQAKNDMRPGPQGRESSKAPDRQSPDGVEGKTAPVEQMQSTSRSEEKLKQGIDDFYASRFSQADDAIRAYLSADEKQHAGAAHFFLGASLTAQALLTSPKDQPRADALRHEALEHFVMARQLHYQPIEGSVSPKILAQCPQVGEP